MVVVVIVVVVVVVVAVVVLGVVVIELLQKGATGIIDIVVGGRRRPGGVDLDDTVVLVVENVAEGRIDVLEVLWEMHIVLRRRSSGSRRVRVGSVAVKSQRVHLRDVWKGRTGR
jgi:hypothetical protein